MHEAYLALGDAPAPSPPTEDPRDGNCSTDDEGGLPYDECLIALDTSDIAQAGRQRPEAHHGAGQMDEHLPFEDPEKRSAGDVLVWQSWARRPVTRPDRQRV